jgi:PadR family transcriptional regulator, regulatory protein AphA
MSLPHLILGMLKKQPMSGYDLNKAFQQGVAFFWTTEQSQIYRALKKLEKEGLVQQRRVVQDDYPDKKVYSLTEAGEQAILNWLKTPLTLADAPVREGWLGQLFYGEFIPPDDLINVLDTYIADTKAFITSLQNLQEGIHAQLPPQHSQSATLRLMTLDYGLHIQQAFLDWLIHARSMIQTDDEEANG